MRLGRLVSKAVVGSLESPVSFSEGPWGGLWLGFPAGVVVREVKPGS